MPRIFISNGSSVDLSVVDLIERLQGCPDVEIDQSPLNPLDGDDPRWGDWYSRGLSEAISRADYFVAVVTSGYDSATWMAQEFLTAWQQRQRHGRPQLFIVKPTPKPLARGFMAFEQASTILVGTPEVAAAALLADFLD